MAYQAALVALADPTRRRLFERLRSAARTPWGSWPAWPGSPSRRCPSTSGYCARRGWSPTGRKAPGATTAPAAKAWPSCAATSNRSGMTCWPPMPRTTPLRPSEDRDDPAPRCRRSSARCSVSWSQEAAFRRFTVDFASWWPWRPTPSAASRSRGWSSSREVGGRIFEEHADGRRFQWGGVLEWDPPPRVKFTFHPLARARPPRRTWRSASSPRQRHPARAGRHQVGELGCRAHRARQGLPRGLGLCAERVGRPAHATSMALLGPLPAWRRGRMLRGGTPARSPGPAVRFLMPERRSHAGCCVLLLHGPAGRIAPGGPCATGWTSRRRSRRSGRPGPTPDSTRGVRSRPATTSSCDPSAPRDPLLCPTPRPGRRGAEGNVVLAVQAPELLSFTWDAPATFPDARGAAHQRRGALRAGRSGPRGYGSSRPGGAEEGIGTSRTSTSSWRGNTC